MGAGRAEAIRDRLIAHGRSPQTSVAVIQDGTTSTQRLASGVLAELPAMLKRNGIRAPALIVIGETAALATEESGFGAGTLPGISSASWNGVALAG
jgi:uroporphyrin-III C-methyltransferase/precorrin-2 dehydrogenase/sirohydrochlorin ferrochelatase